MLVWLQHTFGFYRGDGNSESYLFWSGVASDLGYVSVLWGMIVLYRKHNCRRRWCPRIGRHELTDEDGVVHLLCWKHHPKVTRKNLTGEQLRRLQSRTGLYLGDKPGRG